jgi:hypothetical protein
MKLEPEVEVDASIKEQIDCFLNSGRICGPDCVSWVTNPVQDKSRLTFTQRHCLLLSSLERLSRHITIMAGTLADIHSKSRTEAADRQRKEAMGNVPKGPFADPFPLSGKKP